jgi:ABC-2 type transport system ATP-binding protein
MRSITVKNLYKTYAFFEREAGLMSAVRALFRRKKVSVDAVRGIDLEAALGLVGVFIGPNGAGKTTTLKMLSGILYPTRGEIDVLGFTPSKREKAFLKSITLISGQRNRLFWDLPAEDYFQFVKTLYEISAGTFRKNVQPWWNWLELVTS